MVLSPCKDGVDLKDLMDDFISNCRNKECTYEEPHPSRDPSKIKD